MFGSKCKWTETNCQWDSIAEKWFKQRSIASFCSIGTVIWFHLRMSISLLDLCKIEYFIELCMCAFTVAIITVVAVKNDRRPFSYDRLIRESKPNDIIKGITNQYLPWFLVKHVCCWSRYDSYANSIISLSIALMIQILFA